MFNQYTLNKRILNKGGFLMNPAELVTLDEQMSGFCEGRGTRTWYTTGNMLPVSNPLYVSELSTFVCAHQKGEISVGLMGYSEGSLTFFLKETFLDLPQLRLRYPHLFDLPGHRYSYPT